MNKFSLFRRRRLYAYGSCIRYWAGGSRKSAWPRHDIHSFHDSAFVGLAMMILTSPLPGVLTKLMEKYQVGKMEKVSSLLCSVKVWLITQAAHSQADARVQMVTEGALITTERTATDSSLYWSYFCHITAVNVMRMIKLFGWEKRISEQISEKREEELVLNKKNKLAGLCLGVMRYAINYHRCCLVPDHLLVISYLWSRWSLLSPST